MPDAFVILTFLIILSYFLMILAFTAGWSVKPRKTNPDESALTTVSVLIPCRNEAENILPLATALENQDYPSTSLEIIWIDDHSADQTSDLIREIRSPSCRHRLITLHSDTKGKKAALQAGMKAAKGEIILLTDADSRPGPEWVSAMVRFMLTTGTDLAAGPVVLSPANRWHEQLQKLEFMSLVASSAGAAGIGLPFMIQGPNIAIRASEYRDSVSQLDRRFLSGDDVFLLQAMKKKGNRKIRYNLDRRALVESKPAASLMKFLWQRHRWASKARGYTDPAMVGITITVFLANLTILVTCLAAVAGGMSWWLPAALFIVKSLADLSLLIRASGFFKSAGLLIWFLPVQILYPAYIVVTAIWAMTGQVRWKSA